MLRAAAIAVTRWRPIAAAAGVAALVGAALAAPAGDGGDRSVTARSQEPTVTESPRGPLGKPEPRARGRWRELPPAPGARPAGYSSLEAVRVGRRAVFVAGASYAASRVGGLMLDLRSRRWTRLRPAPLPYRDGHGVVSTGREAIVWGGSSSGGAILDPARNRWRRVALAPLAQRGLHAGVWTGDRMVVWGGSGRRGPLADGAAYDPSGDHWQRIAPAPLSPRARVASVWTGTEMVVWGGDASRASNGERGRFLRDGAAYDPANDRWRRIARAPITASADTEAVWTGARMLVWTGRAGAAYDPARDRWRRLPRAPLTRRRGFTAVWDGTRLLVWGGVDHECGDCFVYDGAAYHPRSGRWLRLPASPLARRDRHAAVARASTAGAASWPSRKSTTAEVSRIVTRLRPADA